MRGKAPGTTIAMLLAGAAGLAGCAGPHVAEIAQAPAAASVPPRPVAPADLPAAASVPARTADGGYETPNHDISAAQAAWHVRAALNVAALGCRGEDEAALIASYNAVLVRQKAPLAAAYKAVQSEDRARFGRDWEVEHDAAMTRLYNFFAQPFAKAGFCATAASVMARAGTVEPAAFAGFAPLALDELEAPFTAGYRRYDAYRQELAAWDAAYASPDGPRLAYAPLDTILAWAPPAKREQIALGR